MALEEQEVAGLGKFWARSERDERGLRLVVASDTDGVGFELRLLIRPEPALLVSASCMPRPWWSMVGGMPWAGGDDVFMSALSWTRERAPGDDVLAAFDEYRSLLAQLASHATALCKPEARKLALRFRPASRLGIYGIVQRDETGRMGQLASVSPGAALFAVGLQMGVTTRWIAQRMARQVVEGKKLDRVLGEAVEAWLSGEREPVRQLRLFPGIFGEQVVPVAFQEQSARLRLLIRRAGPWVHPSWLVRIPPPLVVPEDIPAAPHFNACWYKAMSELEQYAPEERADGFAAFVSKNLTALRQRATEGRPFDFLLGELRDYLNATRRKVTRASGAEGILRDCGRWHEQMRRVEDIDLEDEPAVNAAGDVEFPAPPVEGVEGEGGSIKAIRSLKELVREGNEMRHCGATRARQVLMGRCYIYSATAHGGRLTVELVRVAPGLWRLGEVRALANAAALPTQWLFLTEWARERHVLT
jgi:hypothetical protein